MILAIVAVAAAVAFSMSSSSEPPDSRASVTNVARAMPPVTSGSAQVQPAARGPLATLPSTNLPSLPLVQFPAPRPPEVIRAVYEFAAHHPEVMDYIPCYCGCENFGHQANHDCFVDHRDAEGNVTWEAHGMG